VLHQWVVVEGRGEVVVPGARHDFFFHLSLSLKKGKKKGKKTTTKNPY